MKCSTCGHDICDACWKARADLLRERDDARAEAKRLRTAFNAMSSMWRYLVDNLAARNGLDNVKKCSGRPTPQELAAIRVSCADAVPSPLYCWALIAEIDALLAERHRGGCAEYPVRDQQR